MVINKKVTKDRKKWIGLLLAILFAPFAWIYTWKFDKSKFWFGLIVYILFYWTLIIPIAIRLWVLIDMFVKDDKKFNNYNDN